MLTSLEIAGNVEDAKTVSRAGASRGCSGGGQCGIQNEPGFWRTGRCGHRLNGRDGTGAAASDVESHDAPRFVDPLPVPALAHSEGTRPSPVNRKVHLPY